MARLQMTLTVDIDVSNSDGLLKRVNNMLDRNMASAIEVGLLDFDDVEIEQYSYEVIEVEEDETTTGG